MRRLIIIVLLLSGLASADTHTYTTTGNLSGGGDKGVAPVDGDAIAITGGSITMDMDMTAWTGLAASTITSPGKLIAPTSAGTYCLKLNGTLSGTGAIDFDDGSNGELADNIVVNVNTAYNGSLITLSGACDFRCTEPAVPVATLKNGETATTTKCYLNESLDSVWSNGRYVRVSDIGGAQETEEFTISATGTDGGGQYVTLSAGLAATKSAGATVALMTRNIQFTGNSGASQYCFVKNSSGSNYKCGARLFTRCFSEVSAATITGGAYSATAGGFGARYLSSSTISSGVLAGSGYGISDSYSLTNSGGWIVGNIYALYTCYLVALSGQNLSGNTHAVHSSYLIAQSAGTITGGTYCYNNCTNCSITGGTITTGTVGFYDSSHLHIANATISNFTSAFWICYGFDGYGLTISGNTYVLRRSTTGMFNNCTISGGTRYYECNSSYLPAWAYGQTTKDSGTANYLSAVTAGGTVAQSAVTYPTGHTLSYAHSCSDASYPCFRQDEVQLGPYERGTWTLHYKLSNTTWTTDPKFEVCSKYADPLIVGGAALATVTCSDADTDWHLATITYLNSTANPIQVYIRATAQDAAYTLYERMDRVAVTMIGKDL